VEVLVLLLVTLAQLLVVQAVQVVLVVHILLELQQAVQELQDKETQVVAMEDLYHHYTHQVAVEELVLLDKMHKVLLWQVTAELEQRHL
jgi:hypothetical protein